MRVPNGVLAAKCSDRWIGLRSPVTSAKPTTSEASITLLRFSVMPTERSSKYSIRKSSIFSAFYGQAGRSLPRKDSLGRSWEDIKSNLASECALCGEFSQFTSRARSSVGMCALVFVAVCRRFFLRSQGKDRDPRVSWEVRLRNTPNLACHTYQSKTLWLMWSKRKPTQREAEIRRVCS